MFWRILPVILLFKTIWRFFQWFLQVYSTQNALKSRPDYNLDTSRFRSRFEFFVTLITIWLLPDFVQDLNSLSHWLQFGYFPISFKIWILCHIDYNLAPSRFRSRFEFFVTLITIWILPDFVQDLYSLSHWLQFGYFPSEVKLKPSVKGNISRAFSLYLCQSVDQKLKFLIKFFQLFF